MKRYLKVGLILMGIATISAGFIGLTNFLTKDTIIRNEQTKKENACKEIYKDATKFGEETNIEGKQYCLTYTLAYQDTSLIGSIYYLSGKNTYGQIKMMVGINNDSEKSINRNLKILTNEQSFASTLMNNYINPFINGQRGLDDVTCGATYGAKLVRSMVLEAQNDFKERSK